MIDVEVRVELQHDQDRALLADCAREIVPDTDVLIVRPLGRFGYSGARLYLAWPVAGRRGMTNVIKINATSEIEKEHSSIQQVWGFFAEAREAKPVMRADLSAIVYPLVAPRGELEPVELKELVFARLGDPDAETLLARILDGIYEGCCRDAHGGERHDIQLGEEYKWYRRGDAAVEKIRVVLGEDVVDTPREFLGAEVLDPRCALARLEDKSLSILVADAVHGDLHPNNVLLDSRENPRLIDFGWGHRTAHVLKDFVLLECSLRFLLFPGHINLDVQLQVDRLLLEEDGPAALMALPSGRPLSQYYHRLGFILGRLRAHARRAARDDYEFSEYLHAQFCVLFGLLKVNDYHQNVAIRALGLIGNRIAGSA